MGGPLYLGFDLSTQQLKVSVIDSKLEPFAEENVVFDVDLPNYDVKKGVHTNAAGNSVYAPVAMWIEALDIILNKMKEKGFDFSRVKGISGAGQQHGSVYWSENSRDILKSLDSSKRLVDQLSPNAFSHPWSPNWQDHSTGPECDTFESNVGGPEALAQRTGSKAHHRFTGPQILRLKHRHPDVYKSTKRITLVSSFLASILLGDFAPFDISDVCGMNLWNLEENVWDSQLLEIAAGGDKGEVENLAEKLGPVEQDGGKVLGNIDKYFVDRYGFPRDCIITPFTGDNPATILALPLRPLDVIVSLGTSTTLLMSTPTCLASPAYHLFNHPTSPGLYMFMLCYCNGSLAREHIRDQINFSATNESKNKPPITNDPWILFNQIALSTPPLGKSHPGDPSKLAFYFPLPEIVPRVKSGTWRLTYNKATKFLNQSLTSWSLPNDDARAIVESQALSMRSRSQPLLVPCPSNNHKRQPRRIYVVGGASKNTAICEIIGQVLGGVEGVYRLDVGANACALGAAYKACWAVERKNGQGYEEFLRPLWKEGGKVVKVVDGYREGVWEEYENVLEGFVMAEDMIIREKGH